MIGIVKSTIALTYALSLLGAVAAVPYPVAVPSPEEVDYAATITTGEGLPTIAELGLTNADLTKPLPEVIERDLVKRFNPQCWGENKCNYSNALACYNYLNSLGGTTCAAQTRVQMCISGGCHFYGYSENGAYASSTCSNVAAGSVWVLNNCSGGGVTAGANAAFNNGNLIVQITTGN